MTPPRSPPRLVSLVLAAGIVLTGACTSGARGPNLLPPTTRLAASLRAELEQVTPLAASATAVLSFHNPTRRPVQVLHYRVRWRGGMVLVRPSDLRIEAGATRETPLVIGPEAGDLDALYASPMGAAVEVLAVASP